MEYPLNQNIQQLLLINPKLFIINISLVFQLILFLIFLLL